MSENDNEKKKNKNKNNDNDKNEKDTNLSLVDNIHDEMKEMEKEKDIIEENIKNLENLHFNLKSRLNHQEKKISEQNNKISLEQVKLKNEHEINILIEENKKIEKYLQILSKKYELELKYIEQYCDHKSRVEKMNDKYAFIDLNNIVDLESNYKSSFTKRSKSKIKEYPKQEIQSNTIEKDITLKPKAPPPPPPVEENNQPSISNQINIKHQIQNNKESNIKKTEINKGSLEDQLKSAFSTKYKALQPVSDNEDSSDDSSFN